MQGTGRCHNRRVNDVARHLAELETIVRRAGKIAQDCRSRATRELKPDGTIVTNGDREVELFLRDQLTMLVQDSAVWGEEFGHSEPDMGGLWVVDPIDGTSNYSFGSPLWGVSVGLVQGDEVVLGAIALPDLDEVYLSASGHGAIRNGKALPNIPKGPIKAHELVSYNDHVARALGGGKLPGKMRLAGSVVIDGAFVACQRYRGLIGIREKLYDIAPLILILRELDADVRYGSGQPLDMTDLLQDKKIGQPWVAIPKESGFFTREA